MCLSSFPLINYGLELIAFTQGVVMCNFYIVQSNDENYDHHVINFILQFLSKKSDIKPGSDDATNYNADSLLATS